MKDQVTRRGREGGRREGGKGGSSMKGKCGGARGNGGGQNGVMDGTEAWRGGEDKRGGAKTNESGNAHRPTGFQFVVWRGSRRTRFLRPFGLSNQPFPQGQKVMNWVIMGVCLPSWPRERTTLSPDL